MAFDGIVTKAIVSELSLIKDSRVDKVFQPNKNEIILGFYLDRKNYALDICIDSQNCRLNLTTNNKPNPQIAPNFCMLLRKNLIGLKLKNIFSMDLERLIILDFEGFDEIDDIISKKLVIELMGKHSNIILLDESNIIIDSIRHIKEVDENFRNILPHTKYIFPTSAKNNFLELKNFDEFKNKLSQISFIEDLPIAISKTFNGISKNFIQAIIKKLEITDTTSDSIKMIFDYITSILNKLPNNNLTFQETVNEKSQKKDYFLIPSDLNKPFNLNFFIDDFYFEKETNENFRNYRNTLLKLILETLKKYQKRLYNIDEKLNECKDMDKYRIYGELITANLYKIPNQNLDKICVQNYYDNNKNITIPLDKKYLPNINAKKYFKKYNKLKNALIVVTEQKNTTLSDLDYLESIVYELENAFSVDELTQIFEEISENDIFKEKISLKNSKKSKIKKSKLSKNKELSFNPIKYKIDNYTVFVGRNNKENDYLTLKFANKNDLWFHTKDFHGSHTILKIDNSLPYPDDKILIETAKLAAKHSKAKNSSHVPVDYCEVKYVKKPSAAKPGMVIYTKYKTLVVN